MSITILLETISPFRQELMSMLMPHDLSNLAIATNIRYTTEEKNKYLNIWRYIFKSMHWINVLCKQRLSLLLIGRDIKILMDVAATRLNYKDINKKRLTIATVFASTEVYDVKDLEVAITMIVNCTKHKSIVNYRHPGDTREGDQEGDKFVNIDGINLQIVFNRTVENPSSEFPMYLFTKRDSLITKYAGVQTFYRGMRCTHEGYTIICSKGKITLSIRVKNIIRQIYKPNIYFIYYAFEQSFDSTAEHEVMLDIVRAHNYSLAQNG